MAAVRGERTLAEFAERAEKVFATGSADAGDEELKTSELHAKIDPLTMENDSLSKALTTER